MYNVLLHNHIIALLSTMTLPNIVSILVRCVVQLHVHVHVQMYMHNVQYVVDDTIDIVGHTVNSVPASSVPQ